MEPTAAEWLLSMAGTCTAFSINKLLPVDQQKGHLDWRKSAPTQHSPKIQWGIHCELE